MVVLCSCAYIIQRCSSYTFVSMNVAVCNHAHKQVNVHGHQSINSPGLRGRLRERDGERKRKEVR